MPYQRLIRCLLWCLLLIAPWQLAAAATAECAIPPGGLSLSATLSTLKDPDMALSLEAARARFSAGGFERHLGGMPSFGFIHGALWAHVQLPAVAQPCTTLLVLEQPRINTLDLFVAQNEGGLAHYALGVALPFSARAIAHRFPNVRIARQAGPPVDVFIRVQSAVSVQLPLSLYTESGLFQESYNEQAGMGMYYGLLLALLLYSVAVMVGIRDASYVYYVLYLAALGLFSLNFTGYGAQYLWPDATHWPLVSLPLSFGAVVALASLFACNFLDLARTAPLIRRVILFLAALGLASGVIGAFQWAPMYATLALTVLVLVASVVITLGAILSALRGYRPARYFLLAWCLLLLGAIAVPLSALGWIPRTMAAEYGLQIGSAAEMLLLSFALVYRINVLRDKKEHAEREALQEAGRRHMAENLRRSQEQYRLVVDNVSEGMVVVQHGKFIFANPALLRLIGYDEQEILGKEFLPLVHADDRKFMVANHTRRAKGEAFESKYDFRALHRSGQSIWVHISTVVVQWDGAPAMLSFISDIAQRKQAEEDARAMLDKQRELNGLKSRFVSVTSHEFRTPLSTILSSSELLKYYSDKMPLVERNALLDNIETAVARMTRMINDILMIGKSDADKLVFAPRVLPLRRFCESLVNEIRATLDPEARVQHVIDFRMTGDADDALFDEALLRQIFSNLLSNAIKYSPEGGRVFFGVGCHADEIWFHVADRGIGMPQEDVVRLFETFFRASNVGNISGTGLGLSIVRRAVERHGGTIKVDSVLGSGTRFVVILPRQTLPAHNAVA